MHVRINTHSPYIAVVAFIRGYCTVGTTFELAVRKGQYTTLYNEKMFQTLIISIASISEQIKLENQQRLCPVHSHYLYKIYEHAVYIYACQYVLLLHI